MHPRSTLDSLAGPTCGFAALVLLFCAADARAANRYVRQGAAGDGSGADWTNAFTTLPAALQRGDTYYIADGSYSGYTFDDAESGTAVITIRKATEGDHGVSTGWNSTFGDGQATFTGALRFARDYYTVTGQTRDENNWTNGGAYGLRVTGGVFSWPLNYPPGGDHLRFSHMDVGGPPSASFSASNPDSGFYFVGNGNPVVSDIVVSRSYIHNVEIPVRLETTASITIEYSHLGPSWGKEVIRGSGRATDTVIRFNVLKDGCQDDPSDPTANGCTAEIAIWDGSNFDRGAIYGNVLWNTIAIPHSDGCFIAGGDGRSLAGVAANNWTIANNTIVGVRGSNCQIRLIGSNSGNVAANNLYFGVGGGTNTSCLVNSCQSNSVSSSDPFVNAGAGNFRLTGATAAGTALTAPYNVDPIGLVRGADGTWDRGAFEFSDIPARPTNLRITR